MEYDPKIFNRLKPFKEVLGSLGFSVLSTEYSSSSDSFTVYVSREGWLSNDFKRHFSELESLLSSVDVPDFVKVLPYSSLRMHKSLSSKVFLRFVKSYFKPLLDKLGGSLVDVNNENDGVLEVLVSGISSVSGLPENLEYRPPFFPKEYTVRVKVNYLFVD